MPDFRCRLLADTHVGSEHDDAQFTEKDGGEGVRNHRISVDRTLRAAGWVALLIAAILLMEGTRLLAPAVVFVAAIYGGIGVVVEAGSSLVFGSRHH